MPITVNSHARLLQFFSGNLVLITIRACCFIFVAEKILEETFIYILEPLRVSRDTAKENGIELSANTQFHNNVRSLIT